ncbi:hypothetical protein FQ087_07415 [Sporosarcina sp. ANT_H38]|uniref:hypothetical protein n=1 Tax=Sporosarcina sp. ANT_H38 TaxID=2597358 RepID=UPI0011F2557E|nr:hypothetical protein [Sporosarcina sp. ANT_H38]KAA0966071.1 hypothetical protein FQ087_07415 [Sporosarcina sp. ANT_H38]
MRILLLAVLLFVTIHFIRLDLVEGTIPLASFDQEQQEKQQQCEEVQMKTIPVTTVDGDTIETLFALYPDPESGFIDRLSSFYALNPHLQNQKIIGGENIVLPLSEMQTEKCIESE